MTRFWRYITTPIPSHDDARLIDLLVVLVVMVAAAPFVGAWALLLAIVALVVVRRTVRSAPPYESDSDHG